MWLTPCSKLTIFFKNLLFYRRTYYFTLECPPTNSNYFRKIYLLFSVTLLICTIVPVRIVTFIRLVYEYLYMPTCPAILLVCRTTVRLYNKRNLIETLNYQNLIALMLFILYKFILILYK